MNSKNRDLIRIWVPLGFIRLAQRLLAYVRPPALEFARKGWQTPLKSTTTGWNTENVTAIEKRKWDVFVRNCEGSGPLGFSHESDDLAQTRNVSFHNIHMTFAYVLALAAHQKNKLSVLDWGSGLGHYYVLGKSLLPDVTLDYHCVEVPMMAQVGKVLNPSVHWYADNSWFQRTYDLVMINGSLQYLETWPDILQQIDSVVKNYLFLTRIPIVEHSPGFVAIQRAYGTEMFHQQFNQADLLKAVQDTGLCLVREFIVGDRPLIVNAPEQCELRGWLFKRGE